MNRFPYITDYVNECFEKEKKRLDYIFIRPILLILYFFLRVIIFPLKYCLHRSPYGFEGKAIDRVLAFGFKYLASNDAVELVIRHVQIEPVLYRHLLLGQPGHEQTAGKLKGIDGEFDVDTIQDLSDFNMTIAHDELSYELNDRFEKQRFLENLEQVKAARPVDISEYSRNALEINKRHSLQWFGSTNVVMFIVFAITIFGDLKTTVKALNSFGSDSIALWALKHIYQNDPDVLIDLEFYMQVYSNRSHYNSSVFFSDPSQYLYYHIVFDEFVYETLLTRPPTSKS
ncbi:MAG: DUF6999 family protein [Opitutales bacterium]